MKDLRYALRQLAKFPGFTAVAVLTLALGIGANTAIFSVFYSVLLRPLPYPEQDRLVFIHEASKRYSGDTVSYGNFLTWREQQKSFTAIGVARPDRLNYIGASETEPLKGAEVSHDLFAAIGLAPVRGRLFTAADDQPGAERTVVIGASLWNHLFGGRDSVIGEKINLSGAPYAIIGVLPDELMVPLDGAELWIPISLSLSDLDLKHYYRSEMYAYGRLKPGVALESAQAEMRVLAIQIEKEYPNGEFIPVLTPLSTAGTGQVRPTLYVLLGAAGFVLLIACTNVANLQLARAQARRREFAVRAALGSGRGRIVRQLLVESLLFGLLGCGAGLLLGSWVLGGLKVMLPSGASRVSEASLNGWVLGFAVAAGLVTSLLSGLVPAFHAARQDVREALAQASRSAGSSRANRWRAALIAGEFALTSVLLVGASLMLRTLDNLHRVDLGFTTEHLVTFNWVVKGGGYDSGATRNRLFDRAIEHLAAVPGVTRVGLADTLPLEGDGSDTVYCVKGSPSPKEGEEPSTGYNSISGEYFATLGMKLLAGRTFDVRDSARAPAVVIVDTMFVEREFHGQNPLGQRFFTGNRPPQNESAWFEIVGVVSHINRLGPGQSSRPQVYFTTAQWTPNSVNFVVRTDRDPVTITPSLRAAMREVAGDLPILSVRTMDQLLASGISAQRFIGTLLGAFAALALLLAGVGLFGGLSYNVGQRTHEIGVRAALGATPGSILGLVLRSGLKLAGVGLALGLLAALGLTRFLQSVLYEVSPFDPVSFAAVSLVLAGIGAFACWLPARRATKVDPIIALRAE